MKIIICGVTGIIGQLAMNTIKLQKNFELVGIVFGKNYLLAKKIISKECNIKIFSPFIKDLNNVNSFEEMLKKTKPDLVINAISGFDGLNISLLSIEHKISLGLANKESLVLAGWYICKLAKKNNVKIFPIDSEHSAIFDILENTKKTVNSILITMSGGKYFNKKLDELNSVTFEEAIIHPKWKMGHKISIDSSTFMNKCYEIIEAFYLFNSSNIRVVHHPEAIIHALVEFSDSSIFAYLSNSDMQIPINTCLNYFSSKEIFNKSSSNPLDFKKIFLHLNEINNLSIKPINWGLELIKDKRINKTTGVILISANESAINLFKLRKIKYKQIIEIIEISLFSFRNYNVKNVSDIFKLDCEIKEFINKRYL